MIPPIPNSLLVHGETADDYLYVVNHVLLYDEKTDSYMAWLEINGYNPPCGFWMWGGGV